MVNICIAFYCASKDEKAYYPMIGDGTTKKNQSIYWKQIVVFFATSCRYNPLANSILFTNKKIDDIPEPYQSLLKRLSIKIYNLPFTYRPPIYSDRYQGTFYRFDVINYFSRSNDINILLDPDCIFIKSVNDLVCNVKKNGFLFFNPHEGIDIYKENHDLSDAKIKKLYKKIYPMCSQGLVPFKVGGEFFCATKQEYEKIAQEINFVFNKALKFNSHIKFCYDHNIFTGTEYIISFAISRLAYKIKKQTKYIKRLWNRDFKKLQKENFNLTLWHCIDGKRIGFVKLFKEASNPKSEFWSMPLGWEFNNYIAGFMK